MRIIFIHGMNQQNFDAETLKQYWLDIFQQGINESHIHYSTEKLDIAMPFYGDLITKHQLSNNFDLNSFLPKSVLNFHLRPQDDAVQSVMSTAKKLIPRLPYYKTPKHLNMSKRFYIASHLIKDKALREFSVILNNFPQLHESLIHKFLIETYLYLADACFMEEVHQRISASFDPDQEHIIVAHSLGSIIAYNLLRMLDSEYSIRRLITLGSPLAFNIIQSKLVQPIIHPSSLKGDWHNFYSTDDFLTTFPLTKSPFDFQPPIMNTAISTFIHSPHEIMGYLQHPAVIQNILELFIGIHCIKPPQN